jgi:hypothetical protein
VFKRRENYTPTPQTPTEAKAAYNQVRNQMNFSFEILNISLYKKQVIEIKSQIKYFSLHLLI